MTSDKTDYVNQSLNHSDPDTTASGAAAPDPVDADLWRSTLLAIVRLCREPVPEGNASLRLDTIHDIASNVLGLPMPTRRLR